MKIDVRALTAILILLACRAAGAQEERDKWRVVIPMRGGYFVTVTTNTEPPNSLRDWSSSFADVEIQTNTIRRVFIDKAGSFFFGYDLVIEPVTSTKQSKVLARPLSPEFERQLRTQKDFQARRMHPDFNVGALSPSHGPQIVEDGDTFALDVLINERTGMKIVNVVRASFDESRLREAPLSTRPPRDFTLADVELKVNNYKLLINGEMIAGSKTTSGYAGSLLWFHSPQRGRFILSLIPHAGYDFRKVGLIEHNRISFTWGEDRFEWVSTSPVVGSGGNWNLWVLHDPNSRFVLFAPEPNAPDGKNNSRTFSSDVSGKPRRLVGDNQSPINSQNAPGEKPPTKSSRPRLVIGTADRMENLLPRR